MQHDGTRWRCLVARLFRLASKVIFQSDFQADFRAPVRSESGVAIVPPARRFAARHIGQEGRVRRQLSGSAHICMGAMILRNRPIPIPRRLLCRDRVNTNEHFIQQ